MTICSVHNCRNNVFAVFHECALHCEKSNYQSDKNIGLIDDFNKLLFDNILNEFSDPNERSLAKNEIKTIVSDNDIFNRKITSNAITHILNKFVNEDTGDSNFIFRNIIFPERQHRDHWNKDYFKLISIFDVLQFEDCIFSEDNLNVNADKYYFGNCIFQSRHLFHIFPTSSIFPQDKNLPVFWNCIFKTDVVLRNNFESTSNKFKGVVFIDCDFKCELLIEGVTVSENLFRNTETFIQKIKKIIISNSTFEQKLLLNKVKTNDIIIKDASFKSKLEVKESEINTFVFKNSNVDKVFDAYKTIFKKFKMEKCIFEDFSGFEFVEFGDINNQDESYITLFKHVTFKNTSNFRNAKFFSGLDLENINLSTDIQPSFLKVEFYGYNTNRETFRIIKKSFDEVGNHIEANKYFSEEMKVYRREVEKKESNVDFWTKAVIILNDEISSFGQSYEKPIILLILVAIIFTSIKSIHIYIYELLSEYVYKYIPCLESLSNSINEVAKNILPFSSLLEKSQGIELISLLFYIVFSILIWQIFIAVKRKVIRE